MNLTLHSADLQPHRCGGGGASDNPTSCCRTGATCCWCLNSNTTHNSSGPKSNASSLASQVKPRRGRRGHGQVKHKWWGPATWRPEQLKPDRQTDRQIVWDHLNTKLFASVYKLCENSFFASSCHDHRLILAVPSNTWFTLDAAAPWSGAYADNLQPFGLHWTQEHLDRPQALLRSCCFIPTISHNALHSAAVLLVLVLVNFPQITAKLSSEFTDTS